MAAVKALQQWCRIQCEGYRDVSITNMTTSFRDGLAFCALIHKHRPDLIKFDSLKKEDIYDNNKLAFKTAEEELGIPALLDAEDMVALKVPDRLSILTYVSQYYNYFHGRSPIGGMAAIKRPAEGPTNEPCGKKNQLVTAKVFPSSRPVRENSPPPSTNITRPPPSPKQTRNATQHILVEKPQPTGTLSNKCVSCNNHVHLVQRHLVDGKLYHRSCAKLLSTSHTTSLLRDFPTNTPVSKFTPLPDSTKTNTASPTQTCSRLEPTWLKEKPIITSSFATNSSSSVTSHSASGVSSIAKGNQTLPNSTSIISQTSSERNFTTSTSINTSAPSTSNVSANILQSKLKFFQSDCNANSEGKKTIAVIVDKGSPLSGGVEPTVGQAVAVAVNVGGAGRKETDLDKGRDKAKAACVGKANLKQEASECKTSKASAAAFISKKLTEDNNNSKLSWVKNTDKLPEIETPKREMENNRARIRLRVDPSLLGDLNSPDTTNSASGSASRSTLSTSTLKPGSASPNNSASENESPADWRSRLKPVAKETKSGGPTQSTTPRINGAGKSQTSELSVGPSSSSFNHPSMSVFGSPAASKEIQTGQREQTAYGSKSESKTSKSKPGYIPKEDIMKELQDIEDNLNELEKRGVEMEMRLRSSEEEGKDDSLMDELMVEWFNLIRNKQVAIRRESELVYIGRTQDLEEQQPSVEQELRRLMDKPEHLRTEWDKKREQQLMDKLLEIINDRNSIVEGLDEDRLREEEEDEQLNKMMMNFNIKKDKPKKESAVTKLFRWGSKKEK